MKTFVVVVSIWGNNGTDWVYIVDNSNWNKIRNNEYYDLQFDCFNEESR